MLSFHNDPNIKAKYVQRVTEHIEADRLVRGTGWNKGKGCAVGCTLESYAHHRYETELGIPEWLARLEDLLFENMSLEKSRLWPKQFLESIPVGVNLEQVKGKFLISVLEHALTSFDNVKFVDITISINRVIYLWRNGGSQQQFIDAAYAAAYAADATSYVSAAYAANAAAYAAAYAATHAAATHAATYAAYAASYVSAAYATTMDLFADKLLALLKEVE